MTRINSTIHNTTKIQLGEIKENEIGNPFFTRDITIYSEGKMITRITCFSDKKDTLEIEVKKLEKL